MAFLMGSSHTVSTASFQKPYFTEVRPRSTVLPPPFTESFSSPIAPHCPRPTGLLPWFQSETPTFRPRVDRSQVRPTQNSQKPWMTGEILFEIRKKHSLLQRAKYEDTIVSWNEFKQQRSLVSQMLNDAKLKHELGKSSFSSHKDKNFYCDSCDRSYASEKELNDHIAEHIYCSVDDCSFKAHPKVVALHRKMQHDTGLAKKIMSLDTPEDIKKWRDERKRNFPTAENVERRKKEVDEKRSRGELLENKYFGKMKGRFSSSLNNQSGVSFDRGNGRGRGQRGRGRRRRSRPQRWKSRGGSNERDSGQFANAQFQRQEPTANDEPEEDDFNGNLKRFKGTNANYETEELIAHVQNVLSSRDVEAKNTDVRPPRFRSNRTKDCSPNAEKVNSIEKDKEIQLLKDENNRKISRENEKKLNQENKISFLKNVDLQSRRPSSFKDNKNICNGGLSRVASRTANQSDELEEGELIDSDHDIPASKVHSEVNKLPSFFTVNEDEESDDEVTEMKSKPIARPDTPPMKVGGALGSLIATYGEDSESEGEVKAATQKTIPEPRPRTAVKRRKPAPDMYPISRRRTTLLEKLLQGEIRKERNVILQCVHHIVKNNFFNVEKSKTDG